jgi:uncharacterized protein (TIGR02147 family)
MPNIYNYLNYRKFLGDFYKERKTHNPRYSFQSLADQAGFKSKSYLKLVMDGKKNLTGPSLKKINKALKLSEKSFSYLKDLVAFNQLKDASRADPYFARLSGYSARNKAKQLRQGQYEYLAQWYHSTIREAVTMPGFNGDYKALGKTLQPPVPVRKVKHSVELMQKLGLIKKEGGRFVQNDALITTGNEAQALAVKNFHLQNLKMAGAAINLWPAPMRDVSCLVLGLSDAGLRTVKQEIQLFRKRLLEIAGADQGQQGVYHVGFNLFPTYRKKDT